MNVLSRRPLAFALAATLLAGMAAPLFPNAAHAQSGLPRVVMIAKLKVAPENHDAFRAWIAEFRALVEGMIAEGRLSPTDTCAYKSWRVLGPDPAGLNDEFLFVFEPVIPIANYLLQHYIKLALEPDAADEMMARYVRMSADEPEVIYASPLTAADAVDLGEVCDF